MNSKLLKIINKRVKILCNLEEGIYIVRDTLTHSCSGGTTRHEYDSEDHRDIHTVREKRREYILRKMYQIRNENKWFWQKDKYAEPNIIEVR